MKNIWKRLHFLCEYDTNHIKYPSVLICKKCGHHLVKIGEYTGIGSDGDSRGIPIYETIVIGKWLL